MKTSLRGFRLIAAAGSILLCSFAFAQSKYLMTRKMAHNACYEVFLNMSAKLYESVITGKLKAYSDSSLTFAYTPKQVAKLTLQVYPQQIINPENPNDPYDLIDTVITSPFHPDLIIKLGIGSASLQYFYHYNHSFTIKKSDALKLLGEKESWLIRETEVLGLKAVSREWIKELSDRSIDRLNARIYNSAMEKKLKPFRNADLEKPLSAPEAGSLDNIREIIQIINPDNPTDPYDLVDTLIITPIDSAVKDGIWVNLLTAKGKKGGLELKPVSYAISYTPKVHGKPVFSSPVFWVSELELKPVLSGSESQFLDLLLHYSVRYRLSPNTTPAYY